MNLFSLLGILVFGFAVWLTQGRVDPGNLSAGTFALVLFALFLVCFHYSDRIRFADLTHLKIFLFLPIAFFGVTAFLRDNLMYASLVQNNPSLAFIGPLRWIPGNSYLLFKITLGVTVLILILCASMNMLNLDANFRSKWIFLLLGLFLFVLTVRVSPLPIIDVFTTNTTATLKLLEGNNPYSIKYVDIYQGNAGYLPSFGYLPGYFLAGIPALVLGDVRLASIASLLLVAFLISSEFKTSKIYGLFTASVFGCILLGGSSFYIIEQAWIDPIIALAILLGALFLQKSRFILAGICCGVAITIKQYAFISVIFLILFCFRKYGIKKASILIKASVIVAVSILLPFIMWDFRGFYDSAVVGIRNLPPRLDSLSFRSFLLLRTGFDLSSVSLFLPLGFCFLYARRIWGELMDLSGVFMVMGFMYFIIFVFSSHAFANYYYLVFLFFLFSFFFSLMGEQKDQKSEKHI
jgi:hypothetical protein